MSQAELLDRVRQDPAEEPTPYDTHPPTNVRVAAIEAMRAAAVVDLGRREGFRLLRDPTVVLDAGFLSGLVPEARDMCRVDWDMLSNVHGLAAASAAATAMLDTAARLTGRDRTIRTLLDVLDNGRIAELSPSGARPELGPRARREHARPAVRNGLWAVAGTALAEAGAARWEVSWSSHALFAADEPYAAELMPAIEAAVADRADTAGLRELLGTANIDLDRTISTPDLEESCGHRSTPRGARPGVPSSARPSGAA